MQPPSAQRTFLLNQVEFAFVLRRLLTDYAHWTRELILLSVLGSGTEAVQRRLRRNAEDLAGLVRQIYGERNATRFEEILNAWNTLILEWIKALIANDMRRIEELNVQWYALADTAARFISTLNRNYDRNEFQTVFYDLIYMTQNEASDILSANYAASIERYDQIIGRLMDLAEDITFVVMRQFQI